MNALAVPLLLAAATALFMAPPAPRRLAAMRATPARASPEHRSGAVAPSAGAPRALAWVRRVGARGRDRRASALACVELCQGMAAELRAGRTAADALDRAASELAGQVRARFVPAVAAARSGGDVEPALAALGAEPGLGGLTGLAACWRVGAETGTGFATVLDRLTETLRADIAHRAEVAAQLAGARSSARLLAGLPVVGLALAASLGTNPLAFLLRTPYGLACLTAGVALDTLGLLWTRRLATNAEERT